MEANERFGKYYSGVIIEAMERIACREMQGSREKVLGMDIFPRGLVVKNLRANAGATEDVGSIPGSRRFPGEGNGRSLQYVCVKSFMDRGAWWATVHGIAKSRTRLSSQSHTVRPMTMTSSCKKKFSDDAVIRRIRIRLGNFRFFSFSGFPLPFLFLKL